MEWVRTDGQVGWWVGGEFQLTHSTIGFVCSMAGSSSMPVNRCMPSMMYVSGGIHSPTSVQSRPMFVQLDSRFLVGCRVWLTIKHRLVDYQAPFGRLSSTIWSTIKHHLVDCQAPFGQLSSTVWSTIKHRLVNYQAPFG